MKEALATGSEAWWRTKTGPEWIREKDGNYRVTFWWRDPQGNETHSPIRRVWVYITGVTDHHQTRSLRRWRVLPERMSGAGARRLALTGAAATVYSYRTR